MIYEMGGFGYVLNIQHVTKKDNTSKILYIVNRTAFDNPMEWEMNLKTI